MQAIQVDRKYYLSVLEGLSEDLRAFLDDDMHSDELMSFSLSAEAADAETARRYQMMGDALRGEMSDASFIDVSHAVREALAGEESYDLQPDQRSTSINTSNESQTADDSTDSRGFFDLSAWFKPVAGIAVAAFVAVIMVVTVSGTDGPSPVAAVIETQPVAMPSVQLASDNNKVQKSAFPNTASQNTASQNTAVVNQHVDQRLVNQHLEYATQDTLQGRMPLVRAVSYEAEK